jgi:hypothetical protein
VKCEITHFKSKTEIHQVEIHQVFGIRDRSSMILDPIPVSSKLRSGDCPVADLNPAFTLCHISLQQLANSPNVKFTESDLTKIPAQATTLRNLAQEYSKRKADLWFRKG